MAAKTAIITGAASGIGRHWAGVLALRPDFCLALADVDAAGLAAAFTADERVRLYSLDIRSLAGWQTMAQDVLAHCGRIDYLFNIAGGGRPAFFLDLPPSDIDFGIDLNLKGPLYGMKVVGQIMAAQGSGHIVNVGSLAGVAPTAGNSLYSAAKAGLRHASLAAAVELRPHGVYVTLISPDLVDTPILRRNMLAGPEVALSFSGARALTVVDMQHAFEVAMARRPLEMNLPRWRGWLARATALNSSLALVLYEPLQRRGLKKMAQARRERLGPGARPAAAGPGPKEDAP